MDTQIGCAHYKRKCIFLTPCCNKKYTCRLCHDAAEDHQLNRKAIKRVQCALCTAVQPVAAQCRSCKNPFGKYICLKCNLFDMEEKGQFHCDACGICRVGGQNNFYHCTKCGLCLNRNLLSSHKCVENASRTPCPICLEDIHSSVNEIAVPKCGHLIHTKCLDDLKTKDIKECTICKNSM